MQRIFDTIIVGSGIAGLNLARKLALAGQKIFICSKEAITEGSSKYAQGGIAVVSPLNPEDNLESHIQDTLKAGKDLCNEEIVKTVLTDAWSKVNEIIDLGVSFDKSFNLEASHSYSRVMHIGDATGRVVMKALIDKVSRNQNIFISQGSEVYSLIRDKDSTRVCGVLMLSVTGETFEVFANNVVLASGGLCALYEDHTCPNILTGDGIALAYDAGAKIENLEFVQFHPTVFKSKSGKNFLISETLRGEGAKLRNSKGEMFAANYHPQAEMATRDVLTRAIFLEMKASNSDFVFLDARNISKEILMQKFPNIYQYCLREGFDLAKDLLPIRPAAHYSIGGIKTDIRGRTNIKGLYALGECASTGLHGANRLASNSLLECIVMSDFISESILKDEDELQNFVTLNFEYCSSYPLLQNYREKKDFEEVLNQIRAVVSKNLSLERKLKSLQTSLKFLESLPESKEKTTAILLVKSALMRSESRGSHYRADFPRTLNSFQRSTILSKFNQAQNLRIVRSIDKSLEPST